MTENNNLTAALAKVQAELPRVAKGETAEVLTKTGGKYSYRYADLATISAAILPLLGKHGLAWVTAPDMADGRLVLRYELRHTSGEAVKGSYPLTGNTPQELGSSITYARRYCLCSVTGVAPDQDDDDAAAASQRPQRDDWEAARPRGPQPAELRAEIARVGRSKGMPPETVAEDFREYSKGVQISATDDVQLLGEYLQHLRDQGGAE